jgi:Tfp pilus assembly protein PilO
MTKLQNNKFPAWLSNMTSTVVRCHLWGSLLSVALIMGIVWVGSLNDGLEQEVVAGGITIDLYDAALLIDNADQWWTIYAKNMQQKQALQARIEQVGAWLPRSCDWAIVEKNIRELAAVQGLKISAVQQGQRHVGIRVGVITVACEVTGSYESLCQFINQLSKQTHPIACSEIKLTCAPSDQTEGLHNAVSCLASLTLRVPFAAKDSIADQLLAEKNNAS